jgi:hypothetical protein
MIDDIDRKILRGEMDTDLEMVTAWKQKRDVIRKRRLDKIK